MQEPRIEAVARAYRVDNLDIVCGRMPALRIAEGTRSVCPPLDHEQRNEFAQRGNCPIQIRLASQ